MEVSLATIIVSFKAPGLGFSSVLVSSQISSVVLLSFRLELFSSYLGADLGRSLAGRPWLAWVQWITVCLSLVLVHLCSDVPCCWFFCLAFAVSAWLLVYFLAGKA